MRSSPYTAARPPASDRMFPLFAKSHRLLLLRLLACSVFLQRCATVRARLTRVTTYKGSDEDECTAVRVQVQGAGAALEQEVQRATVGCERQAIPDWRRNGPPQGAREGVVGWADKRGVAGLAQPHPPRGRTLVTRLAAAP
jgi:hypothetical protein